MKFAQIARLLTHDTLLYSICIALSAVFFYMSIADILFVWLFPDEIGATLTYKDLGLIDCIKHYYFNTTINRFSAGVAVCLMSQGATWFNSPYIGWIVSRLILYSFLPISISIFFKRILDIPYKLCLSVAFVVSAVTFIVIYFDAAYIFGLDLAIYQTATMTYFLLLAFLPSSAENNKCFAIFCGLYFLNLNSQEVFLVISAGFIPLFAWYRHKLIQQPNQKINLYNLVKKMLLDKKIIILCIVYLSSAAMVLLAPGVAMRQKLWPSSGSMLDGFEYMILTLEDTLSLISHDAILFCLLFLLGMGCRYTFGKHTTKHPLLFCFLFISPLAYLILTGFLVGITPSLWMAGFRTPFFRIVDSFMTNQNILSHGGLAIRQLIFPYTLICASFFATGFLVTIGKRTEVDDSLSLPRDHRQQNIILNSTRRVKITFIALGLSLAFVIFAHPDHLDSLKMLSVVKSKDYSSDKQKMVSVSPGQGYPRFSSLLTYFNKYESNIFPLTKRLHYDGILSNFSANQFIVAHKATGINYNIFKNVYNHMGEGYHVTDEWLERIIYLYGSKPRSSCILFSDKNANTTCQHSYGKLTTDLDNMSPPKLMSLNMLAHGVEIKDQGKQCIQFTDSSENGEHFVYATVPLSKGKHYLIFSAESGENLYTYLIGEQNSILIPWNEKPTLIGESITLTPVVSELATSGSEELLKILIDSHADQTVTIRLQHGQNGNTIYKGSKENISTVCGAQLGDITNKT